jgi:hypothetical protein
MLYKEELDDYMYQ